MMGAAETDQGISKNCIQPLKELTIFWPPSYSHLSYMLVFSISYRKEANKTIVKNSAP